MTKITMIPVLQCHWQLEYSGEQTVLVNNSRLNLPEEQCRKIALDTKTADLLRACDGRQTLGKLLGRHNQTRVFYNLIAEKIVVDQPEKNLS
jgi:hypothetical protein